MDSHNMDMNMMEMNSCQSWSYQAGDSMKALIEVTKTDSDDHKKKSRRIEYKTHNAIYYTMRFLFECGYKLKANPITIATASVISHRFFKEFDTGYDKYLIAATSLYIAGKLKDEKYKLRDVINVAHQTLHRGSSPLDFREEYFMRRDAIVQAELLIMRTLQFRISTPSTHKYLLHYLSTLKTWLTKEIWETVPLCQSSFAFLQDFHHDPLVLEFAPQNIALGCIHLAMQCYGVDVPCIPETDDFCWFTVFYQHAKKDDIWQVIEAIMDIYNREEQSPGNAKNF
ncbi:cyclin-Q-like [Cimex lectularius]|uniref:Cyclin-Q n=1 Tax=Cimex lectularius TaxID=79782 RepID=A0A8I6S433_CIMLE|nr:cyclin-Q-like [Cimex lectularius]